MAEVIVEYGPESVIIEESNTLDSEPEGPYIVEPSADDNWIAKCSRGLSIRGRTEEPGFPLLLM